MTSLRPAARKASLGLALLANLAACGGQDGSSPANLDPDGGVTMMDADVAQTDADVTMMDAGVTQTDAAAGPTVALTLRSTEGWGVGALHIDGYPDCTGECTYDVPEGATVVVTATPGRGQSFGEWTGDCSVNVDVPSCTLVLDAPRTAAAYFTGGNPLASVAIGGAGEQRMSTIAATTDGDFILCGSGDTTIPTADGGSTVVYGGFDAFIGRIRADGSFAWITRTRGAGQELCDGVAVAPDGMIYVTGNFQTELQLGTTTMTSLGGIDSFVASLDAQGSVRWVVRPNNAGASADHIGRPIVHSNGGVYVPGQAPAAAVVLRFAASDGSETRIDLPTSMSARAYALAEAPDGDLYVGGGLLGDLGVPVRASSSGGDPDLFVARITTTGAIAWAKCFGNDLGDEEIYAMDSDAAGNLYLGGEWSNLLKFPSRATASTAIGSIDWFLLSYDAFGNARWARTGGGAGADYITDITIDAMGTSLYVTGVITGTGTNTSTTQVAAPGYGGAFLARIDSSASAGSNFVRTFIPTGGNAYLGEVSLQSDGLAVVGGFGGSSTLGMGASAPVVSSNGIDGFVHFSGL